MLSLHQIVPPAGNDDYQLIGDSPGVRVRTTVRSDGRPNGLSLDQQDVIAVSHRLGEAEAVALVREIHRAWGTDVKIMALDLPKPGAALPYLVAGARGYTYAGDDETRILAVAAAVQRGELMVDRLATAELCRALHEMRGMVVDAMADYRPLTKREQEVLALLRCQLTNRQIAERLFLEEGTVKNHVHNILRKLNVSSRKQAASYAPPIPVAGQTVTLLRDVFVNDGAGATAD
jgi:DNA-binding NarL/FixJ family response regulator